jgi:hypothetical protein
MTPRRSRRRAWAAAGLLAALLLAPCAAAAANAQISGSVYVDYWGIKERDTGTRPPEGITPDASLTVGSDIGEELSFSVKACFSCHGVEVQHFQIDYQPRPWFNVQAGRIAVPFGDYSNRVDPSAHKTASAPLIFDMGRMAYGSRTAFNEGVVPLPYSDTGLMVYGQTWLGSWLQIWYGLYAVAGLRGANDVDFMAQRSLYYTDNNNTPSLGGRLTVTWASEPGSLIGDLSLGASATGGKYDVAKKLEYRMWGADASVRIWTMTLRGEYAQRRTDIDPSLTGYTYVVVDRWFEKSGFYGEAELPLGKRLAAVGRYDLLERRGVPLPGANAALSTNSRIERYTAGVVLTPAASVFAKLSFEYWKPTDFPEIHSAHLGFGGAF